MGVLVRFNEEYVSLDIVNIIQTINNFRSGTHKLMVDAMKEM